MGSSLTYLMDPDSCGFWDSFAKEEDFKFHAIQTNILIFEFKDFGLKVGEILLDFPRSHLLVRKDKSMYRISSYNCRGNYSFLNSSSEETIQVFISLMS